MDIEHLVFNDGPKRVGPFSHAVKAGGFLFVTGQMPTLINDPTKLIEGDIISQTHQVMKNLKNVLTAANSSLNEVFLFLAKLKLKVGKIIVFLFLIKISIIFITELFHHMLIFDYWTSN